MALRHDIVDRLELESPEEAIVLDLALDHLQHAVDCSRRARAAGDDDQHRLAHLQASRDESTLVLKALQQLGDLHRARRNEEQPEQGGQGSRWE